VTSRWEITEQETVNEIIFRTTKVRNRLMLELIPNKMAGPFLALPQEQWIKKVNYFLSEIVLNMGPTSMCRIAFRDKIYEVD
jgi:hypothetical protein